MALTIHLAADVEERLLQAANIQGISASEYAAQLLATNLNRPSLVVNQEVIDLLQAWRDPALAEEQKSTGEYLVQVLDEDRPSNRKLFPAELKGITW